LKALDAEGRLAPANKKSLVFAEAKLAAAETEVAFKAGEYSEATALQKELAYTIEKADITKAGKAGAETADVLGTLAWYELSAQQFEAALAASERALGLAPGEVWLATNRAHALMFLGRADEARAAYLQHRGERPLKNENKTWEQVVLQDFAEFEKHGLTNPQMAEIRALLIAPANAPPEDPRAKAH
jgi:lipoprotein NlpI